MKASRKKRFLIFSGVLIISIMACNLFNIGENSASIPATPTAQPILAPTATKSGFNLTARAEEVASLTKEAESTPIAIPPNVTASGLKVTQVNGYVDTFGSLQVVGIVENQTERTVGMIEIEVQVLDAEGNEISREIYSYDYQDGELTPRDKLQVFPSALELIAGGTPAQLTARLFPKGLDLEISWTSDNKEIASVTDQGIVDPISTGEALIIASAGEDLKDTAFVTVLPVIVDKDTLAIIAGLQDVIVDIGDDAEFSVSAEGENIQYRWRVNGTEQPGERTR